ncbi:MAG: hypothetical protein FWE40_07240 [Oscillospiraceae bacterium]|nr:hypothetical protein [Oscillospiraceae bacterium]
MKKLLSILLVFALLFGVGAVTAVAQQPAETQCAEAYNTNINRPEDPDTFNWLRAILIALAVVVGLGLIGLGGFFAFNALQ